MAAELTFLTHAETDLMRTGRFAPEATLSPRGRDAAARLRPPAPGSIVMTSPARAARETAQALQVDATSDPRLADLDLGSWVDRDIAEIGMAQPEAATAWISDPTFRGHGGESILDLLTRVGGFLESERVQRRRVLAMTHGAVLRAAVMHVLGAPGDAFWKIEAPPLTRLVLTCDGRRWTMRALGG